MTSAVLAGRIEELLGVNDQLAGEEELVYLAVDVAIVLLEAGDVLAVLVMTHVTTELLA